MTLANHRWNQRDFYPLHWIEILWVPTMHANALLILCSLKNDCHQHDAGAITPVIQLVRKRTITLEQYQIINKIMKNMRFHISCFFFQYQQLQNQHTNCINIFLLLRESSVIVYKHNITCIS